MEVYWRHWWKKVYFDLCLAGRTLLMCLLSVKTIMLSLAPCQWHSHFSITFTEVTSDKLSLGTSFFPPLSFVCSCTSALISMEIWTDWTAPFFPSVDIAQMDTDFQRGFTTFFTSTGLERPGDKYERCSHRWNLSFLYQPVDCSNLLLFQTAAAQKVMFLWRHP